MDEGRHVDVAVNPWVRTAAWLTAAVTLALLAAALILQTAGRPGLPLIGQASSVMLIGPLISALVGAIVIDRRGNHPVGWLFVVSAVCWAIAHLGMGASLYIGTGGEVPGGEVLLWATSWSSFLAFALAPGLVMYVFPDGRLTSPKWRWWFGAAVAITVIGVVGPALTPGPLEDVPFDNPFGIGGGIGAVATLGREVCWPLLLLAMAAGVVSVRQRMRTASFDQRQQIKWFLFAGVVMVVFVTFWGASEVLGFENIAAAVGGLILPVVPTSLGIAILRHRLYDIDVLINRTLVYASLSAVLAVVYLGTVVVFQRLLSTFTTDSNIAIAASTLAVAALFRPLRARVQEFIDRRFYRQKYDAAATVGRFSTRLRHEVDIDALERELLAAVDQTLQPLTATVWLKTSEPA